MSKSNSKKDERNDVYTAFAVLGLFLLFGFFISRLNDGSDELVADWVEQPAAPAEFQGYPYPHDDKSVEQVLPEMEDIEALPQRKMRPVASAAVATTVATVATFKAQPSPEVKRSTVVPTPEPTKEVQPETAVEKPVVAPAPIQAQVEIEKKAATVVAPAPKVEEKVVPKAPVAKSAPKPVVAAPKPAPKVTREAGMNYISSELPCVWIVGIFKNPNNVNRVVARLRLNKFEVGTGAHEKGTYVGVPCACTGEESKAVKLREIFSAQPWLLRK